MDKKVCGAFTHKHARECEGFHALSRAHAYLLFVAGVAAYFIACFIVAVVFARSQKSSRDLGAEHMHSNSPPFGYIFVAAHAVCRQRGLLHDLRQPLPNGELDVCIILFGSCQSTCFTCRMVSLLYIDFITFLQSSQL